MRSASLFAMLRVKQWTKNLLIFLPLLLDNKFTNVELTSRSILGFFSFCLMASACYILNDIRDIESDRVHIRKHKRQIASGNIGVVQASVIALILILCSVAISTWLGKLAILFVVTYFVLNYFYSGPIKKIKYFDIVVLTSFYLLRLLFAWGVTQIMLTELFMVTCTFLFLAASANKRHIECLQSKSETIAGRGYSKRDATALRILTIAFALLAITAFNVHAITVLKIANVFWIVGINVLALAVFYFFFETRNNHYDDPVDRILKKPHLLLLAILFAGFYIFLVITRL
jgi:4-hydroxybenzoate polyprenyltransferase